MTQHRPTETATQLRSVLDGAWRDLREEFRERAVPEQLLGEPGRSLEEQRERVTRQLTELAADTALLHAAPLGLRHVGVVVVDPHGSVTQAARHALGTPGVLRPDCAGQAVDRVVRDGDGGVLGGLGVVAGERLDGEHGA